MESGTQQSKQVGDGDIGISPVLLQAVTQTLGTTTSNDKRLSIVTTTTMAKTEPGTVPYSSCGGGGESAEAEHVVVTEEVPGIGANEQSPQQPSSTNDALAANMSPDKNQDGHLVIKVIGDSFGDSVNRTAIMDQLRQRLGIKVVVQMENADGEVVFEDTVSPGKGLDSEVAGIEDLENGVVNKDSDDVTSIVKTVVNTIRDLSAKIGKQELKECPICGDTVTGFHYGVQTCESCKGFFKRTVQNKKLFTCHRNGTCDVHMSSRKKCPGCRFQKCCDVGMKIEGIREDRSRGGRSSYDGASMMFRDRRSMGGNALVPVGNTPPAKRMRIAEPIGRLFTQPVIPKLIQEIVKLESLYEESSARPQNCCIDRMTQCDRHKFSSMLHITEHRLYQIVKWARHLPNFPNVHTDDQILLLQNSWAELVSLGAIWRSRSTPGVIQLSFGKRIDMKKAREMDHEEVISRMLHVCDNFRRLKVDLHEYVCLKVLALMLPDIKGLKDVPIVQDFQNHLLDALMIYTTSHYPNQQIKLGELLLRLSEVQRMTAISRVQLQHCKHPDGECQLLKELCRTGWQHSPPLPVDMLTAISRQQILSKSACGEVQNSNGLLMELLRSQSFDKGAVISDDDAKDIISSNYSTERVSTCYQEPIDARVHPKAFHSLPSPPDCYRSTTQAHMGLPFSCSKKEASSNNAYLHSEGSVNLSMRVSPASPTIQSNPFDATIRSMWHPTQKYNDAMLPRMAHSTTKY